MQPAPSSQIQRTGTALGESDYFILTQPAPVLQPKPEKVSKPKTSKDPHAPKKSRNVTNNNGAAGSNAEGHTGLSTDSGSNSEDDLVIEDEEPPEATPTLLTVSKPTDERGRALYEAVQVVWSPRNKPAPPEKIRSAIAAFGDIVRNLRDAWKARNDSLRKAELPSSPTASQAAQLKEEVSRYRQLMEGVMARSLLYAHPAIIKRYVSARVFSHLLDSIWPSVRRDILHCVSGFLVDTTFSPRVLLLGRISKGPCLLCAIRVPHRISNKQSVYILSHTSIDSVQLAALCGFARLYQQPGT